MEEFLKAIPVYFLSMLKFILGPTTGFALKLHFLTTVFVTVAGMMTVVAVFTFFGEWIKKRWFKKTATPDLQQPPSKWQKYGLPGIAILTPLILTPLGGTILAVSSGAPRGKIIFFMFVSAAVWSLLFTGAIYFIGSEVVDVLPGISK